MPESVLNSERLADALVGAVDEIRSLIHGELGTRPNRVWLVKRTWSGDIRGLGTATLAETEILPPPMVTYLGLRNDLRPTGRDEEGDVLLTEVSLAYSEAELYPSVAENEEFAYRIDEAHGQARASRYLVPARPPVPRRGDHPDDQSDWAVTLRLVEAF
jgi:hypothetical protein